MIVPWDIAWTLALIFGFSFGYYLRGNEKLNNWLDENW